MDSKKERELTTRELIEFAQRHSVPLGRLSPSRTITYYIRLGLLPPRLRKSDGRFRWAFAPQSKALLLRIRDLKRNGLTLIQIRDALAEEAEQEQRAAQLRAKQPRLRGLEGHQSKEKPRKKPPDERHLDSLAKTDPTWDYTRRYHALQAAAALQALAGGNTERAEVILKEMLELAGGLERGHLLKTVLAVGSAISPRELIGLVHGDIITIRVPPPGQDDQSDRSSSPQESQSKPDAEGFLYQDEVPEALRVRGVRSDTWYRMGLDERRVVATFVLDNLTYLPVLPPNRQPGTLRELYGGVMPPASPAASSPRSSRETQANPTFVRKATTGKRPGEWPLP